MFGMTGFKRKRNFANWDKLGKTYWIGWVLSFVGGTVGLLQRSVSHFLFKSIANETDRFCRVRTIWKSKHPKMESKKSNNSAQINRNPAKDQCLAPLKKAIRCFCVRSASQQQKHLLLISTTVAVLKGKKTKKPKRFGCQGRQCRTSCTGSLLFFIFLTVCTWHTHWQWKHICKWLTQILHPRCKKFSFSDT